MKGIIFYFSNTGNTRLLCEYLQRKITAIPFELCGINEEWNKSLDEYGIVGFACFTDQMQIPILMKKFIQSKSASAKQYAFVLNTYGAISGRTLLDLKNTAQKSKFTVLDGISFHVPENYPPMIKRGQPNTEFPKENTIAELNDFVNRLDKKIERIAQGQEVKKDTVMIGLAQRLFPRLPMFLSKLELGKIECDRKKCTQCKHCAKGCPSKAITFEEYPVVNHQKCLSCWKCYNRCPSQAIIATKFGNGFRYPKVHAEYRKKIERV